jgi:8-oxo-dGTP diphosphatase
MRAIFKIDIRKLYARQFWTTNGGSNANTDRGRPAMSAHEPVFRFCHACGGPLEPRQLRAGDPLRLVCTQCGYILYLDPKVAVGTVIRAADDRIVLVRRAIEPGYGLWVFPGGYVDRGEEITAAARREAREEVGLEIRLDGLINIYSYPGRPIVIIVYRAAISSGELTIDDESLEARLFTRAEIPWTELAFRSTREALEDYFTGTVHPVR